MSRTCVICDGEGKYVDYEDQRRFAMYFKPCQQCDGKGYLEKEVMGETISYSSGKVPEGDSLVQRAQQSYDNDYDEWPSSVAEYVPILCGALEEREREVERLSKRLEDCENLSADRWSAHIRTLHTIYAMYGRMEEFQAEVEQLRDASRGLLELMTDYYFHADDPELEAVNRLRRLVGMRDQLPKHLEAELQADEAEREEKEERS